MEITTSTKLGEVTETETCGRCGGSGHYSFNQIDGTRCYGCGGSGERRTKRGEAAMQYSRALRTMSATLIQPGDAVPVSLGIGRQVFSTVTSVDHGLSAARSILQPGDKRIEEFAAEGAEFKRRDDGTIAARRPMVVCQTKRGEARFFACEDVTCAIPTEDKVAHLKAVAAFQDSLTKAGKPRKRQAA